jgi:hypothetical protein
MSERHSPASPTGSPEGAIFLPGNPQSLQEIAHWETAVYLRRGFAASTTFEQQMDLHEQIVAQRQQLTARLGGRAIDDAPPGRGE